MEHPQQTPPPSRHLSRRNTRSLVPGTYEANPRSDCPIDAALVHCSSILRRFSSSTKMLTTMAKGLARRRLPSAFPPSFFPPLLQPSKCGPEWPRAFECPRFHPSRSRRTISAFRGTRTRRDEHRNHLYQSRLNSRSEEQEWWFYRRRGFYSPDPAHPFHAAPRSFPLEGNVMMILRPLLAHHHQKGPKQKNNIKRDKAERAFLWCCRVFSSSSSSLLLRLVLLCNEEKNTYRGGRILHVDLKNKTLN